MDKSARRTLFVLLCIYAITSLIHFAHNAEFLADYSNPPASWSRLDVYLAWVAMTAVGVVGWILLSRGRRISGLLLLTMYAALGFDSLGHYVVAPISMHSPAMNWTIIAEVIAAAFVLGEVTRQIFKMASSKRTRG